MARLKAFWIAMLTLAIAGPCAAAALETYGRLPSIDEVSLSPDGQMLAIAVTNGEQRKVVIQRIADRQIITTLNAGSQKLRALQWAGSNHLIITVSENGDAVDIEAAKNEALLATDYNISHKSQRPLLTFLTSVSEVDLNTIVGLPSIRTINGQPYAFVEGTHFTDNHGYRALYKVDLDRGAATLIAKGDATTRQYAVDVKGDLLAKTDYDAPASLWTLQVWKGHWHPVERTVTAIDQPQLLGLGRDGASILVGAQEGQEWRLRELSADGAKWSEPLPVDDPAGLIHDRTTGRLIGESALVGNEGRYDFFDPRDQSDWRGVTAAYPDANVSLISISSDRRKFVVRVDSPTEGPAFAFVDLDAKSGRWIGDEYLGLKPEDIASVKAIAFTAKDGLPLTGYLTLPRGKRPKMLPLVVFPHGGPAARDEPGFDWWAQAMASRGYAVLQVNYRGSDGFGLNFLSQGFGQWGRKMQTDLSDGVRYLAAEGTIDPARVCIVGASYGGYAALAGASLDPGVYRCAASVSGIADLRTFLDWSQSREGSQGADVARYWTRFMGSAAALSDISPAQHIDQISIPILLVHGKDDTVVPYEQSRMMADALTKAGKPVEFVTLKSEDHWLSRGETRLLMLQSVVAFLEMNNPP